MEKPLIYRLSNPGYTIYHRAALGGLAATVRSWGGHQPQGITAELSSDGIVITWADGLTTQEALRRILAASFKLTDDKLIDLPGQAVPLGAEDLRLAIHNALTSTFLQHNKMRPAPPGEQGARPFTLKTADDETGVILTYKAVGQYAHQTAQKTGLLKETVAREEVAGERLSPVKIPQWCVPGAMGGARDLEAPPENAFLLMFLMIACPVFILRSHRREQKAQYCIVVPDVVDLHRFARALQRIAARSQGIERFSNSYLGRVVGGAEEAALRLLIDLEAEDVMPHCSVAGCLAVAMGKVAWDKNQINRSSSIRLRGHYPELDVFRAANAYFGSSRVVKGREGQGYAVPSSPVPELVAANLAAEQHWCSHFKSLVSDKKDFLRMCYAQRGLKAMKEAVNDADDQAIIGAFHEAWRLTMRSLYDRARSERLDGDGLVERERERLRNAILRTKTADALSSWFLRFCADATKGAALGPLRNEAQRIRRFIFNQRNFDRFQNLCLFALVSYASDRTQSPIEVKE
ncbi:MAG: type I-MYXAN CRISPR-associated Cas8a1/Cmx1 [Pirellulales bacterium]